MRCYNHK